jgi:hypothetical protein
MSPTDVSEKALEALIVASLIYQSGYDAGEQAVDVVKLLAFLNTAQSAVVERFGIGDEDQSGEFLNRRQGKIGASSAVYRELVLLYWQIDCEILSQQGPRKLGREGHQILGRITSSQCRGTGQERYWKI